MNSEKKALFADVLDSVEQLSIDEKETLIQVLHHRISEARRMQILRDIRDGTAEFVAGQVKAANPADLVREIME